MKNKGFTLIELLVVVAIIGILAAFGIVAYNGYTTSANCSASKAQHKKVVNMAQSTYAMCPINGYTYMNIGPGYGCNSQSNSGMTAIRVDGSGKCIRKWDCTTDWAKRKMTAGLSTDHFATHVRAEFRQPHNTSGFVTQDQWQNFLKPNYPERPGITNIRQKGDNIHIATYLGSDCSGGNFSNASGSYLINEIIWP